MTRFAAEVVVVGGGPAGAALSAELARRGREVIVVDRATFPRAKACGECLNPGAVATLGRLGLLPAVTRTNPVSLHGWELVTPRGRSVFAAFPGAARAFGVERSTFDAALLGVAKKRGVKVIEGIRVGHVRGGSRRARARALGVTRTGAEVCLDAELLVGADGLRSVVARGVGAIRRRPRLRKSSLTWRIRGSGPRRDRGRLYLGGEVTVGLAPVPSNDGREDRWNATLVVEGGGSRGLRASGWDLLRDRLHRVAESWAVAPRVEAGPWGSGPFDWPTRRTVRDRTLLVGDAAGYYDPLTGQGIFRALRGAELAAAAIDEAFEAGAASPTRSISSRGRGLDFRPLARYAGALDRAFAPGRRVQRVVEKVVARPLFREPVFALLARWSTAGSFLAGLTGDVPGLARRAG